MRKLLMTMALVALVASPAAIAQTGSRSSGANSSLDKGGGPWPAPALPPSMSAIAVPIAARAARLANSFRTLSSFVVPKTAPSASETRHRPRPVSTPAYVR